MIILLDLNFTLVENSHRGDTRPMKKRLPEEQYRQWLVDLLKRSDCEVLLVTARPDNWEKETLISIEKKTGWKPDGAYFNPGCLPWVFKEYALVEKILPVFGDDPGQYLALESNPKTREMYARHGIKAVPVTEQVATLEELT